jgi:hypothetical protein
MKKFMAMTGLTLALTLLPGFAPGTPAALAQSSDEGQVREQKKESVPLARGSMVNVRGLNGSVTIETWEGETAEIDITVTASDRDALARRPLLIEATANGLTIRTEERREMGRDRGWVRHKAFSAVASDNQHRRFGNQWRSRYRGNNRVDLGFGDQWSRQSSRSGHGD